MIKSTPTPTARKCSCGTQPFYPAKVRAKVGEFERVITFRHGYVCELPKGPNSHGISSMDMLWILVGPKGAIQFVLMTGWYPNWEPYEKRNHDGLMPADIGYHSPKQMYEGQEPMDENCPWIGGRCYYDGSSLNAYDCFKILVSQGEEALWAHMEEVYRNRFETDS